VSAGDALKRKTASHLVVPRKAQATVLVALNAVANQPKHRWPEPDEKGAAFGVAPFLLVTVSEGDELVVSVESWARSGDGPRRSATR
jgi:hypothetical protein